MNWASALDNWRKKQPKSKKRQWAYGKKLVWNWRKAIATAPRYEQKPGLEFHVSHQEVWGRSGCIKWRGLLLLIYECRTNRLFHHVTDLKSDQCFNPDLFWFCVIKAHHATLESIERPERVPMPSRIFVPSNADLLAAGLQDRDGYAEVIDGLGRHKHFDETPSVLSRYLGVAGSAHQCNDLSFNWRGHGVQVRADDWAIARIPKIIQPLRRVRASSSNEFRRQLSSLATQLTKHLKKQKATSNSRAPSWTSLNTARASRSSTSAKEPV